VIVNLKNLLMTINLNIEELKPYGKNAKKHPKKQIEQVAASIKEFGFNQPIVVDRHNVVIVGHGRLEAAKLLGLKEVPVMQVLLDEQQAKSYRLADNKLNESDWDMELVINELKELEPAMLDLTGFDTDLIIEPDEKDDEVPELPEEPKSKLGEVYQLGEHRLMCGDSTKLEDVEKLMNGQKATAVVTDPPYGIGIDGQKRSISKNPKHNRKYHESRGWDSKRPPRGIFEYIISLAIPSVVWGGNYFADLLPPTRGWLYWDKGQNGLTMSDGELAWTTEDKPLRSTQINRGALRGSVHPTQKPLDVITFSLDYLMVPQQSITLDLFGGSGSTLIACEKTNRKCYMMELDPKYIDVIIQRWEDYTGNKAIKL
jgi:hypothetical protein